LPFLADGHCRLSTTDPQYAALLTGHTLATFRDEAQRNRGRYSIKGILSRTNLPCMVWKACGVTRSICGVSASERKCAPHVAFGSIKNPMTPHHPLAHRHLGDDMIDQMGGGLGHAPRAARGENAAPLAGKCHQLLLRAAVAAQAREAVGGCRMPERHRTRR